MIIKTRPRPVLILLIVFCLRAGLLAQENKEPEHACFQVDKKRVLPIEMKVDERDSMSLSGSFSFRTAWSGKQIFLFLPGTQLAYSIRINGFRFGSDPGSGKPSEYNITPFLKGGANILKIEGAAELEVLDSPSSLGVALLVREPIHIRDLLITTHPGEDGDLLVRFHLYLKSYLQKKNAGRSILLEAEDPDGESIFLENRELNAPLSYGQETEMIIDVPLKNPRYWFPGNPSLYKLRVSVDEGGEGLKETLSTLFHISNGQVLDSLFIQNGDSLHLVYCPEDLAKIFHKLTESERTFLIEDHDFNVIRLDGPQACELKTFFLKKGILVLEQAE